MRFDQNIAVRVKGQLTLLLTVFALKFSLGDQIPHTHYLTLMDLIFLIAIGVIVVNLFSSMIISEMYLVGSYKKMRQIELFFDWLGPIILVIALAGSIYSVFYNST